MKQLLSKLNGTYVLEITKWRAANLLFTVVLGATHHPAWFALLPVEVWLCSREVK